MENPQEFLDRNLEELKALQIGEVKVIDGVKLTARTSLCCRSCLFFKCTCNKIIYICKSKDIFSFIMVLHQPLLLFFWCFHLYQYEHLSLS